MTEQITEARLEELRAMPYAQYLTTPEWRATRKRILKRDHDRCQGCHTKESVLHVHHYTYERLGCELDEDLVTLCEDCHKELHRLMADAPKLSLMHKCAWGLGTATIGTGIIGGLMHAPLPAEFAVLVVAFLLAKNSPAIYGQLKAVLPEEVMNWLGNAPRKKQAGELSWVDRFIWGEHLREKRQEPEEEEEQADTELFQFNGQSMQGADEDILAFDEDAGDDEMDTRAIDPQRHKMAVFSELLKTGWRPSINAIYVGTNSRGEHLFVKARDLCHIALSGATGHGKSSLLRLIMAQLCYLKLPVVLLNPHYMIFDKDHNEDWTPYTPYLKRDPMDCRDMANIEAMLRWMVEELLEKRKERTSRGESAGKPFFFILDEYPDIKAEIKDAPTLVGKLLRQGRKYGIFLMVASQDFSVKTLGVEGEGGVRKCFLTTFYVGGDPITAKELLNKPVRDIPENRLGKGTVMLKCRGMDDPVIVHIPYLDNESLYLLLGPSTYLPVAEASEEEDMNTGAQDDRRAQTTQSSLTINAILDLYERGKLSEEAMARMIELLPEVHTDELEVEEEETPEIRQVIQVPVPMMQEKGPRAEDIDLAAAITLWNNGYNSVRKLMRVFPGMTLHQAHRLSQMIEEEAKRQDEGTGV